MHRIKKILCPLSLTSESTEALRYAFALAAAYSAKLILCYCKENTVIPHYSSVETSNPGELLTETVLKYRNRYADDKVDSETIIIEEADDAANGIVGTAASLSVDLIVMRSRRRPRAAALLGSTAETVCRTAPCPVFVTHPQEREWHGLNSGKTKIRRILVGYDFSDDSERSLNYAVSLAQEHNAELHLLYVLQRPMDEGPEISWSGSGSEMIYKSSINRLKQVVPNEILVWRDVKTIVRWGKPYREILAYSQETEVDLICMGASGKHFGIGSLFGSNVDRVLRQSPCPILIARPLKPSVKVVSLKG